MNTNPPTSTFSGFQQGAFDFYAQLGQDNSKTFWTEHSSDYETLVRQPMRALLDELGDEFGRGKLFRPYRDVRFSADKSPYKEHQGGFVATSTKCGYYVQVDADAILIGGGWYSASSDQVARYRASVLGEPGAELAGIVAQLTAGGYHIGGDVLKSQPRGVPAGHPRVGLLRHRSMTIHKEFSSEAPWVATPTALDKVREIWQASTPLLRWLGDHTTDPAGTSPEA